MNEIMGITLELENCESIYISRSNIGDIWIKNIRSDIGRRAANSISKMQCCDEVLIELFPSANVSYSSFGERSNKTVFQRITQYPDICVIDVHYSDGASDKIETPWCSAGENNDNQESYIAHTGHLYIGISEGKKLEDLLPTKYAEDDATAAMCRELYT